MQALWLAKNLFGCLNLSILGFDLINDCLK